MSRGWTYAFERAFIWRVNSSGIAVGQLDPDSLGSPPVTSHALDLRGPIAVTFPEPTITRYEARGGGTYEGSATGGVEALGAGELQIDQIDPALITLARGGSVDTTTITGGPEIYAENLLNVAPFEVGLMLVGRKQKLGSVKRNQYWHVLYPLVTCSFRKPNMTQEGGVNSQIPVLAFDPQVAQKFPWGEAFGSAQGWYNYSEVSIMLDADYPYALTTFVADGVETTFTSQFKPQLSTVTAGRAGNVTAKNGTPTALTSIATSTGVHTLAAAGSSGDLWVSFYQTQRYAAV